MPRSVVAAGGKINRFNVEMSYYKFAADKIFDGEKYLPANQILVTDKAGQILDIIDAADESDLQTLEGILCPGFINCHCHLELSHLKSKIPTGTGLVNFVSAVMNLRHTNDTEIDSAIGFAESEMIRNGIVAVGDICNTSTSIRQKKKGNLKYFNFIEATGFIEANATQRFEDSKRLLKQFEQTGPSSIVPHAPYSVSLPLLQLITSQNHGLPVSIHNQESDAEHEFFFTGKGEFNNLYKNLNLDISFFKPALKSSLKYFLENFQYNGPVILVHNLTTSHEDLVFAETTALANHRQLFWCLCPNANNFISNRLPAIEMFTKHTTNIILGTDSLASNHQLSILEEMKTIISNFPGIKTETMLRWATSNGAKALQMDNVLGRFDKGKKPGLVLLEKLIDGNIRSNTECRRIL